MSTVYDLVYDLQIYVNDESLLELTFGDPPVSLSVGNVINHTGRQVRIDSIEHTFSTRKQIIKLVCSDL